MPVFAQRAKLFAADFVPGTQTQPVRAYTNPLTGADFTGGVVIVLRQVLDEVTFGTGQTLMGNGSKHST